MDSNDNKFLKKIEEELSSLSQDELYNLLTNLGLKGLKKLNGEKGEVIIIEGDHYEQDQIY